MADRDNGLTYADAGVDISAGNALVDNIKPMAAATERRGSMSSLGGFGGLFDLKAAGFQDPILVAATDGVGTKLRLAIDLNSVSGVGTDLVAMCVNDLVCQGAEPLFFLDYFATGKLDIDHASAVVAGIADGCLRAGCALIGGETAEMPGLYHNKDFDLAGFAVGALERDTELPHSVAPGDILLGLPSTGIHSNGYSLVRKIVELSGADLTAPAPFDPALTLGDALLRPTAIYVKQVLGAQKTGYLHGAAHITGGGITENLPRVLPKGLAAEVNLSAWKLPNIFKWLSEAGGVVPDEMLRTFNCGIGMVLVVNEAGADEITSLVGEEVHRLGRIVEGDGVLYQGALG